MNITGKLTRCWFPETSWHQAVSLDQQAFPRPWGMSDWLAMDQAQHWLATWTDQGKCLGFCLCQIVPGDDLAHLLKICIEPSSRGNGLSQQFWNSIIKELKALEVTSIYLEVEESNQRARAFYTRQGFTTLRKALNFYSDGQNALIMQLLC